MSEIILESRITDTEIHEGYNTQQIVITRLISLWNDEPEESAKLFQDVAERLARYDNPKVAKIYHERKRDRYMAIKHFVGGTKTIAQGKTYMLCEERLMQWLRFNR